jgi:hypothetical protein
MPTPEPTAAEPAAPPSVLPLVRFLPPPPEGIILAPPEPVEQPRRWFVLQLWAELRLAVRMYFDPRYRVSRTAQIAFPAFAALLVFNYFFFTAWLTIPFVSPVAERLLDVALAVVAYRVLQRELDRYRAVLEYLAHYNGRR